MAEDSVPNTWEGLVEMGKKQMMTMPKEDLIKIYFDSANNFRDAMIESIIGSDFKSVDEMKAALSKYLLFSQNGEAK